MDRNDSLVLSADSDIAMLAYEDCLIVKEFSYARTKKQIGNFALATASRSIAESALNAMIQSSSEAKITHSMPKFQSLRD